MRALLTFVVLALATILVAGCGSSGEPTGDIAPAGVKIEKKGTGSGPQPSAGVSAPAAPEPPATKAPSD